MNVMINACVHVHECDNQNRTLCCEGFRVVVVYVYVCVCVFVCEGVCVCVRALPYVCEENERGGGCTILNPNMLILDILCQCRALTGVCTIHLGRACSLPCA